MFGLHLDKARLRERAECFWGGLPWERKGSWPVNWPPSTDSQRGTPPRTQHVLTAGTFSSAAWTMGAFAEGLLCVSELDEPHFQKAVVSTFGKLQGEPGHFPPHITVTYVHAQHRDSGRGGFRRLCLVVVAPQLSQWRWRQVQTSAPTKGTGDPELWLLLTGPSVILGVRERG